MKLFLFKNRISGFALAISLFIVLLLSLFLINIQTNEQKMLEQQGFRVLNSLAASMKEKDDVIGHVAMYLDPGVKKFFDNENSYKTGAVISRKKPPQEIIKNARNLPDSIRERADRSKNRQIGNSLLSEKLKITLSSKPVSADSISFPTLKDSLFSFSMSMSDFVSPLLRKDFFPDYIVISDGMIVYNSFPGDLTLTSKEITGTLQKYSLKNPLDIERNLIKDTLQNLQSVIQSGGIEKVTIAGKDYLLFIQPLKFHQKNTTCYIGGLIEERIFQGWKRSLSPFVIILFVLIFLLIIFSFPVLKVFVSGRLERLTKKGVAMTAVSLMAGIILLVVLLSELLIRQNIKVNTATNLKVLNADIIKSFNNETDQILKQLLNYDSIRAEDNTSLRINNPKALNPDHLLIKLLLDDTVYNKYNHPFYKFFKSVFWADEAGNQMKLLTPYSSATFTNVGYRGYFKDPDKYYRIIPKDTVWYGMEPVYSNNSGSWLIAFSTYSKDHFLPKDEISAPVSIKTGQRAPSRARIIVLTSPVYSFENPVLPQGYEFCVVDKSGNLWYHSEDLMHLGDNFITECNNNKKLGAVLIHRKNAYVSATFHNQEYRMFVSPLTCTDLSIITLFNPTGTNSIEVNTTLFTLAFLSVLSVLLVFVYFVIKLLIITLFRPGRRVGLLSAMKPDKNKIQGYKLFLIINCLIIITLIILSFFDGFYRIRIPNFLLFFSVLLVIHSIITFSVISKWTGKNDTLKQTSENKCFNRYSLFIVSWLFSLVAMPAIFTMNRIYQAEVKKSIVTQQTSLASGLNKRSAHIHQFYNENIPTASGYDLSLERNKKGLYFDSDFDLQLLTIPNEKLDSSAQSYSRLKAIKSTFPLRYWYFPLTNVHGKISIDPLSEGISFPSGDSLSVLKFNKLGYSLSGDKNITTAYILSNLDKPLLFHRFYGIHKFSIIYWFALLLLILSGYLLIRSIVKRIFSVEGHSNNPDSFRNLFLTLQNAKQSAVIVSANVPEIQEMVDWSFTDLSDTDLRLPKLHGERTVLGNFETGITDLKMFKDRIRKLEKYLPHHPFALILHKTPEQLIDQYTQELKIPGKETKLTGLLCRFERSVRGIPVIYALHGSSPAKETTTCPVMNAVLDAERKFNPGAGDIEPILKMNFPSCWLPAEDELPKKHSSDENCTHEKEIIRNLQELSSSYYKRTWDALSMEEQFVLLCLAKGDLINRKSQEYTNLLIKKGIVEIDGELTVTSPAFRQFVLNSADKMDIEQIEQNRSVEGNWNKVRVPLILSATGILVLLILTQQNLISNISAILVSVATIVGVFLKISGLLSNTKTKSLTNNSPQ